MGAIAYGSLCLLLYLGQSRLIFFPSPTVTVTPAYYDVPYQEVWLPIPPQLASRDQVQDRVHGWWMPATPSPLGTLLYFHGNGGNVSSNVALAARFHRMGLSVLLIDYRGYGKSTGGFPHEAQVYEDARSAWTYLTATQEISPEEIVIFGQSLGGAIAIELAVQHPHARALIVEGSFTSLPAMAKHLGWTNLVPVDWLLTQQFDSLAKVPALQIPTLYIHGTADQVVPFPMSQALYAATPEPKQVALFANADHYNVAEIAGSDYQETVQTFIQNASFEAN